MIKLGKMQKLEIIRKKGFGVYLVGKEGGEAVVLLSKRQVPKGAGIGGKVEVFIYKDPSDRLTVTMGKPKLQVDETAKLEVKDVAKIGAFLDMGLEEDLLLSFKEQTRPVRKREQYFVTLHVDKSRRLVATMRVYSHMNNQSPYRTEDWVTGTAYKISEAIGAFVTIDHEYCGLIPKKELYGRFREGDTVQARVTRVREDGGLDLCVREKSYVQMDTDAGKVSKAVDQFDGVLPFNNKAKPGVIMCEFNMSKNASRRAVGRSLRGGKICITGKITECV